MRFPTAAEDRQIGLNLRACRLARHLTQHELGAQVCLTMQQIYKYERGLNRLPLVLAAALADILHVPLETLAKPLRGGPVPPCGCAAARVASAFAAIPAGEIKVALTDVVRSIALRGKR